MNDPPPIEVRRLRKVFRQATSGRAVVAIERLDLDIAPREVVAIVGQTGCGKSTFFDLMIGLERPHRARSSIGGKTPMATSIISAARSPPCSSRTGCCRGAPRSTTCKLPLELLGWPKTSSASARWLARAARARQFHQRLSARTVGRHAPARRHRAGFRAAARILLADEAFGHLDEVTAAELRETFLALPANAAAPLS